MDCRPSVVLMIRVTSSFLIRKAGARRPRQRLSRQSITLALVMMSRLSVYRVMLQK